MRPRLLLVDDEQDILDFLERALRRRYEVFRSSDPLAALAQLRTSTFDVLITDQLMPALSGLELLTRAAELRPDMVRVLISGFADVPEVAEALATERIHTFVPKPIDSRSLLDALDQATARARSHS